MKILVAEDDTTTRRILELQLKRNGHEVVLASDGNEAWEVLRDPEGPRLALLDWSMPGLEGIEVCQRVRAEPKAPYTYIIMITARDGRDDVIRGLDAGADDFLTKPVHPDELRVRLRAGERVLRLENQLRRSNAYLDAVLANVDSGALLTDGSGRIVFANAVLGRLPGAPQVDPHGSLRDEWMGAWSLNEIKASIPPPSGRADLVLESQTGPQHVLRRTAQRIDLPDGAGCLELYRDVTREREAEQRLATLASTDHATGLLNRRGGDTAIARALRLRNGASLAIGLFDIDHFKRVNDVHGHAIGDRVIREVAGILLGEARKGDIAVRWGGEELLLALPSTSLEGARAVVERVRGLVQALRVEGLPRVTISGGVSMVADGEPSAEAAIARADARLYEAKAGGRNQVRA